MSGMVSDRESEKFGLAARAELLELNRKLKRKIQELSVLFEIGKAVTSLSNLDTLLGRIVEAAVYITGAEEGALLLLDEETGELYLRAQRGLNEKHASEFKLKVEDTIAGSVVKTGQPMMLNFSEADESFKIKTGYLVNCLLTVPLKVGGKVIGVLNVDNKVNIRPFTKSNMDMLSALADYAAISIENARLLQERWVVSQPALPAEKDSLLATIPAAIRRLEETLSFEDEALSGYLNRLEGEARLLPQMAAELEYWLTCKKEAVNLNRLLFTALERVPVPESIQVVKDCAPDLPPLNMPREPLIDLFVALITNALEAMAQTGGVLTLRSRLEEGQVEIEITDTGLGLTEEMQLRIFDPLFTTKHEKSDFGLWWYRTLVRGLGGEIYVQSVPKEWTTFVVVLPVGGE